MEKEKNNKYVIYIFTSIYEKNKEYNNEIYIDNYSSSEELENIFEQYNKSKKGDYIFIHFTPDDANEHLEYIIYLINNLEINKNKNFYLIVHFKRQFYSHNNTKNPNINVIVDNFNQYFIDNLYSDYSNNIINIIETTENYFNFYNLDKKLYNLLLEVYMNFEIINKPNNEYILDTIKKINENNVTKKDLIKRIKKYYLNEKLFEQFFKQENVFVDNDIDLLNCNKRFVEHKFKSYLTKLFYILETTNEIYSYSNIT